MLWELASCQVSPKSVQRFAEENLEICISEARVAIFVDRSIHVQDQSWIRYRRYHHDIDKVSWISVPAYCDDIVDIVTISTQISTIPSMSKRYRQSFVNIDTSTMWRYRQGFVIIGTCILWRYRRYRYDIDTDFDDIVGIETISTQFGQHRY